MKRLFTLGIFVVVLSFGAIAGLKLFNPELFYSLRIAFEPEAGTNVEEEYQRISAIMALPAISDEKKEILVKRTVFFGASPKMVKLALGEPRSTEIGSVPGIEGPVERWMYHFADDSRPTVLQFEDGKLTSAKKISAHTLSQPETTGDAAPAAAAQ